MVVVVMVRSIRAIGAVPVAARPVSVVVVVVVVDLLIRHFSKFKIKRNREGISRLT